MIYNIKKQEVELDYSVESDLKSFKEEVLDELSRQRDLYGDIPLFFSGGMDSTFILRSLLELGIKPRLVTFSFSEANDDYDSNLVKAICKKYNIDEPEFFYADVDKFIEFTRHIVCDKNITYPVFHGYFMHYALSCFPDQKFYSGMACEYKIYDNNIMMPYNPHLVKQYNKKRLLDYTTSRTFLSYINHEKFISNYKKEVPVEYEALASLYIRDEIYLSCYPDMEREMKRFPDLSYIMDPFYRDINPLIKDKFMTTNTVKFNFDVDKYFERKTNQG